MTTNDSETGGSSMNEPRIDDSELDRRLDALVRVAEPPADSWSAIERRIQKRRWSMAVPAGLAAAAVLCGVALVVSQLGPAPSHPGGIAEAMQAEVHAMRVAAPESPVVTDMESPEALMAAWQDNEQAIDQLEQALERDPGNRLLLEFLTEARMRQARLVRSIGQNQTPNNQRSMTL